MNGENLKVTVVTSYYPPDFTSVSNYYKDIVYDLAEYGANVTLICGIPTRLVDEEITKKFAANPVEIINENLRIIRTGPKKNERKNLVYRTFYHIFRSWCIYRKVKKIETDIYLISSAPPFLGFYGALLAKRAKTIYDLQDMFPDTLVSSGKSKEKSFLVKILRKFEGYVYKYNTHTRIISRDMAETLKSRNVPESKISLIYNWVDEKKITHIERQDNPIFDMLEISREDFYVCYAGNIGLLQNLSTLINAAEILREKEPKIKFIIIGDGAWKSELLDRIEKKDLKNIQVFPMQDLKYVPYVYNLGDIGIVTIAKDVSKGSLPSKTWSIMSASRPIICEVDKGSELESIIIDNKCGLCVSPSDSEGFANAILSLYNNQEILASMGKNGRKFIEDNLTRKKSTKQIMDCVTKVKNEGK